MEKKQVNQTTLPLKDRLPLKLGLLFAGTFLTVFMGGFIWDVLASVTESKLAEENVKNQPAPVVIDPKIEPELAKVLNFEAFPGTTQVRDPFTDRSNLTGQVAPPTAAVAAPNNAAANANQTATVTKVGGKTDTPGNSAGKNLQNSQKSGSANQSAEAAKVIDVASTEATYERMRLRDARISAGGDGGPESSVYAIGDLFPIGIVSGGEGQEEVMFFSQTMNRTMSFPIGARFFDGWLVGKRPEGVEFSGYGKNTILVKQWERDIKTRAAQSYTLTSSPTLGILRED